MTSREKRALREQGIDWREVEAAKRTPVALPQSRKQEMAAAMESRGYIPVSVPPSDSAGGGAVEGIGEPLVLRASTMDPSVMKARCRTAVMSLIGMVAALGSGVPDMPRESPKPWRPK